jgi:ADP-dependent NAD(P)H-hydrate dehydratase / NAD(P)H-hydrate epimerase
MRYLTDSHTMKAVDNCSIHEFGIPSVVLMERAALGVSAFLRKHAEHNNKKTGIKVVCVCGSGNNGADGLAAARQLNEDGIDVHVVFAGTSEGTDEYRLQKSIVGNLGIDCVEYDGNIDFSEYDYIIDAIFGIGLSRAVEGRYAQVIEAINKARENPDTKIIAVDIASGISADNGQIMGIAVKADYTITFGYNKTGIMFYPGASYSGSVKVINAGFVTEDILHKKSPILRNRTVIL